MKNKRQAQIEDMKWVERVGKNSSRIIVNNAVNSWWHTKHAATFLTDDITKGIFH